MRVFLSPDPLGYVDSFDRWLYVGGDPFGFVDPFGLAAKGPHKQAGTLAPAPPVSSVRVGLGADSRWRRQLNAGVVPEFEAAIAAAVAAGLPRAPTVLIVSLPDANNPYATPLDEVLAEINALVPASMGPWGLADVTNALRTGAATMPGGAVILVDAATVSPPPNEAPGLRPAAMGVFVHEILHAYGMQTKTEPATGEEAHARTSPIQVFVDTATLSGVPVSMPEASFASNSVRLARVQDPRGDSVRTGDRANAQTFDRLNAASGTGAFVVTQGFFRAAFDLYSSGQP